eukprot:5388509-Alexandrium_andersonii.AAC.1
MPCPIGTACLHLSLMPQGTRCFGRAMPSCPAPHLAYATVALCFAHPAYSCLLYTSDAADDM